MAMGSKTRETVDSLLNYDVSDAYDDDNDNNNNTNNPFREIDTTLHDPADKRASKASNERKAGTGGPGFNHDRENTTATADLLGLDSEVKIVRTRKPIAKLDEARLLSAAGIPKLRGLARSGSMASKLRLKSIGADVGKGKGKGKRSRGHEYSDAARLLGFYQLWLDNLYPRASFADGLKLIEKVGHGKRMQVMRREWIDEGRLGGEGDVAEPELSASVSRIEDGTATTTAATADVMAGSGPPSPSELASLMLDGPRQNGPVQVDASMNNDDDDVPDDDLLEELMRQN
jgi:replication fork protection complex subunit Csm3/Swi3